MPLARRPRTDNDHACSGMEIQLSVADKDFVIFSTSKVATDVFWEDCWQWSAKLHPPYMTLCPKDQRMAHSKRDAWKLIPKDQRNTFYVFSTLGAWEIF